MVSAAEHLPGCYCHLSSELGESLPGYLLRLAEANGYAGIRELLQAASVKITRSATRTALLKLLADHERLAHIGRMGAGNGRHLARFWAESLSAPTATTPGEALYVYERRVDVDALVPVRSAVCPRCLADRGYAREEWDLAPVTVCVEHEVLLTDECPGCQKAITWDRPYLYHCENCASDLRLVEPVSASKKAVTAATHFQALAPFRLRDKKQRTFIIDWEEMFHLFKAMLLPNEMWAAGSFPATYVAETSLSRRHEVIEQIATTLADSSYGISKFRERVIRALAPLQALPIQDVMEDVGARYLTVEGGFSKELSDAVCREDDRAEQLSAAELFQGHPPSLRTRKDVERYLSATSADVSRLMRLGVLAPRDKLMIGHDADHLLNARRFLDSLVDLDGLTKLVGVAVRESDLHPDGLFPRWNHESRSDARVMPERVIELQCQLIVRWHQAKLPHDGVALRTLLESSDQAFEVVSRLVQHIIMGSIQRFNWKPPFTWVDLEICRNDLQQVGLHCGIDEEQK